MPLYEYECEACKQRFEKIQKYSDPAPEVCARCGKGPVRRLQSTPAIQFKGSGWYITDYARKTSTDSGKSSSGDSSSGSSTNSTTESSSASAPKADKATDKKA